MNKKIKVSILKDKFKKIFFFVCIYNKYKYKQYIINNDLLYTFFIVINFLYKYGFIKMKKNVHL